MNGQRQNMLALAAGLVIFGISNISQAAETWVGGGTTNLINDATNWSPGLPNFTSGNSSAAAGGNNANNDVVFSATTSSTIVFPAATTQDGLFRNVTFAAGAGASVFADDGSNQSEFGLAVNSGSPIINNLSGNTQTFNTSSFVILQGQMQANNGDFVFNVPVGIGVAPVSNPALVHTNNTAGIFVTFTGASNFYLNQGLYGNFNSEVIKSGTGTMYLGPSSPGYTGQFRIDSGNVQINSSTSLGDGGNQNTGWTEIRLTSSALVLTNNINTGEFIYMSGRTDFTPQVINKSGDNVMSGNFLTESASDYALQSDGTAPGDLLEIASSSEFQQFVPGTGTLALQGAGNGLYSGILEDNPSGDANNAILNILKNGAGTWTLNSPNGYSGTTVIQQGKLVLGNTASVSNSPTIAVSSGATFDVTPVGGYSLSSIQSLKGGGTVLGTITAGTGSVISPGDSGAGTLTLGGLVLTGGSTLQYDLDATPAGTSDDIVVAGDISLSGVTTIGLNKLTGNVAAGNYRLFDYTGTLSGDATNLMVANVEGAPFGTTRQTFSVDTSTSNEINLVVAGSPAASLTWVGGLNANAWDVKTTVNFTGDTAPTPDNRFYNGDTVTFTDSGSNSSPINVAGTVVPSQLTFTNSPSHPYTFTGGDINLGGDLNVIGNGNVTFSNGALAIAGNFTASGSGNVTFNNGDFTSTGTFLQNGTGKISFSNTGALNFPSAIALNSGTLDFNRSSDSTLGSALTGAGTLRQDGPGTLVLAGDNSGFSGSIIVASGTLQTSTTGINSLGTNPNSTTVLDGGTLDVNANPNLSTQIITIAGNGAAGQLGALVDNSGAALNSRALIGGVVLSADATIYGATNTFFSDSDGGLFQGNGHNFTIAGGAEWDILDAGETHLANITIKDGATGHGVFWVGTTTFGDAPGVITLENDGRLGIEALSVPITKPIVVSADGSGHGGIVNFGSNNEIDSQITLNGTFDAVTFALPGNNTLNLAGILTGAGGLTAHDRSLSGVTLGVIAVSSDNNNYTGPTTIGGGFGFLTDLYFTSVANDHVMLTIGNGGTTGNIGPGDVTVNAPAMLGFNKNTTYSFANNVSGNGGITAVAAGGVVNLTGNLTYTGATIVNGGLLRSVSSIATSSGVTVNATGIFEVPNTQTIASLAVTDGGKAQIATSGTTTNILTIGSTTVDAGLLFAGSGVLDLNNNKLVVAYTAGNTAVPAAVLADLTTGYNSGTWSGPGIASSLAATNPNLFSLGYVQDDTAQTFTVEYTLVGDLNLDGKLDADDYALLDRSFAKGLPATWTSGDLNYDGLVNSSDYFLIDRAYGLQAGLSPSLLAEREAQFGSAYVNQLIAAVPEPTLLSLGAAALFTGRRRRIR
ncbi:MAG TPA: autotransporter-associated beta strand repeat-containing protein [Tepidisphaeraceae bacterium]|jgi:autotransporter-associated beta strand protein|nr:autotransporter-associated beta strand repeat-containing protein [Tepidisphaeraceae bacterium]